MTSEFLGANILDDEPFIVMPMIPNGNICDYILKNPNCDRLRLVRLFSFMHFQCQQFAPWQ